VNFRQICPALTARGISGDQKRQQLSLARSSCAALGTLSDSLAMRGGEGS
jgi:hypothetical protein